MSDNRANDDYVSDDAPPGSPSSAELNEAQREVINRLGRQGVELPTFETGLRSRLRAALESALAEVAAKFRPDTPLAIRKDQLSRVFGCEVSFLHDEEQQFTWNTLIARGTVAHKAIELSINWRPRPDPATRSRSTRDVDPTPPDPTPAPAELVDAALDSLASSDAPLTAWLHQCSDAERADLRSLAISSVSAFLDGWPPLKLQWHPVTESRSRVELCGGRIELRGKTDLTLGRSQGETPRKVIVDLKTGRRQPNSHRDDLRFYALLETIKLGTPPRALATYYLESAAIDVEDVTESLLEVALRRTVDGIRRYAELHGHLGPPAEPLKRPGPPCRWCALRDDCAEGQEFLAQADDDR